MASSSEQKQTGGKLSEIFDKIWASYETIENTSQSTSSKFVQTEIEESIVLGERAVHMVNDLSLFTTNEHIDEVPTSEIRYLLLPAILGQLMMRSTQTDDRFALMQKAQIYLIDFIRLLRHYGITAAELPKPFTMNNSSSEDASDESSAKQQSSNLSNRQLVEDLQVLQRRRDAKVERFRREKVLRDDLKNLHEAMKKSQVDEDVKRKYYLTLIEKWLHETLDSLDGLSMELSLLHGMSKIGGVGKKSGETKSSDGTHAHTHSHEPSHKPTGLLRPYIITKDAVQKKVFGLGYPGIPTYSVDEFYQQRVDKGIFPDRSHGTAPVVFKDPEEEAEKEREKAKVKKEDDEDDDEAVRHARNWDEWKDDHRTGWGNVHNKG